MSKAKIRTCIVLGALVVAVAAGAFAENWNGLSDQLKSSTINAVTSLALWLGGLLLVIHQLRIQTNNLHLQIQKQSESALVSNRDNERLKLRKDIYAEVDSILSNARLALDKLQTLVNNTVTDLENLKKFPSWEWRTSFVDLNEAYDVVFDEVGKILGLIHKWRVADPRTDMFLMPVQRVRQDVNDAFYTFFKPVIPFIPSKKGDKAAAQIDEKKATELKTHADELIAAINTLEFFIHDLRIEYQSLLLEDLFGRRAIPRAPSTYAPVVLRVDQPETLQEYVNRPRKEQ